MAISYEKLSRFPRVFGRIVGVNVKQFQIIVEEVRFKWNEFEKNKIKTGRIANLNTLENQLLSLLIYYRCYVSYVFLGMLFDMDASNICRLFARLEPMLARKIHIKKDRTLTYDVITKIIADVTESPIQRPKKTTKQRQKYSGKKKRHTNKTEIVMKENGEITSVSQTYGGRTHDFRIRKQEKPLPLSAIKHVDSGYQGLQKLQSNVSLPYKKSKKFDLTSEQKQHNRDLASFRIKIEHKIRELKVFKVLKDLYRNAKSSKYHMRFNIIAGIVNLKNGFLPA
jgi:hypothetical protein